MTAQIELRTRNLKVTNRLENYVTQKAGKLERYLQPIDNIRVELTHAETARNAADRNIAQITLRSRRALLRAEERADDIFAAFDKALDKIERQIERYKGKRYYNRERGREEGAAMPEVEETEPVEDAFQIVRRKRFELVPMTEAEALEQMQLLGHDNFFIFYNAETSTINVLYRRRDGTYGIIEPAVG